MKIKISLLTMAIFAAVIIYSPDTKIVAAAATGQSQTRGMERCTVKDPTGSPLNVRSTPGGKKIVAKLKNGTRVFVENYSGDAKDQPWAEVRLTGKKVNKPLGWVLQVFLDCK